MFRKLVSRNPDLQRLVDVGYAVAFDSNHLLVRDIPYLDADGALQWGAFVAKLEFVDVDAVTQTDHQVFFAGSVPHELDGRAIPNLGGGETTIALSPAALDVIVQRSFSNKPSKTGRFEDFFAKIESYVAVVCGPAIHRYNASPLTRRVVDDDAPASGIDSIFKFPDTQTSRAEIRDLAQKLENDVLAIIGLGGTGGYLLDFVVKASVREIRAFDADHFHLHNAYRSPGRVDPGEFGKKKSDVYRDRYDNFRHGLTTAPVFVDQHIGSALDGVTFAFVCVDKGPARAGIFAALLERGIPFIDVGMGVRRKRDRLGGMLRATYYSADAAQARIALGLAELVEGADNLYRHNIQIAELNAMNAALALLKFKQIRGVYVESEPFFHLLFNIEDAALVTAA